MTLHIQNNQKYQNFHLKIIKLTEYINNGIRKATHYRRKEENNISTLWKTTKHAQTNNDSIWYSTLYCNNMCVGTYVHFGYD